MNKLQQFYVYSFDYERLKNCNFDLHIGVIEAQRNEELITLADNECLRAIRRLTEHPFDSAGEMELEHLITEKKKIIKQLDESDNRINLRQINDKIHSLLFIGEYASVVLPNGISKKAYSSFVKNGFKINDVEYVWLMCGASQQRTNRLIFCAKPIYDALDDILSCGAKISEISLPKYNAYYALSGSASHPVSTPKWVVVPDKEIQMTKLVDWIDDDGIVSRKDMQLNFNLFDGMGLISPQFAQQWAYDIGVFDYLPYGYIFRAPFLKGLVVVCDFHKFASEVAHKDIIIDIYGNSHNVSDVDLILTKSQFKLWNYYKSIDDYNSKVEKSGMGWGISRISPKVENNVVRTNYQFIQVLDLPKSRIEMLCYDTVSWVRGVLCGDFVYTQLYFLGKIAMKDDPVEVWNSVQDSITKALLLEPRLINEPYIKDKVARSVGKRIKESYIGKLQVDGTFQFMIADVYALMEHIFGLEVKGLLKENEHYSNYWNKKNKTEIVAMRAPLTWRSEVNLLHLKNTQDMQEWYKYLTGGIIYNVWGCDCMLHADSDFDGDLCMTTSSKVFIDGAKNILDVGVPITYNTPKAPKQTFNKKILPLVVYSGLDTRIGYITNLSTTMYEMQSQYPINSKEYKLINSRLKFCRKAQGIEIDKAKNGSTSQSFPKEWTTYQPIEEMDSEDVKNNKNLSNSLMVKKRPYFMRYLYSQYNKEYTNFVNDFNKYSFIKFGQEFKEVQRTSKNKIDYDAMMEYYNFKNPLLETNGTMNRICRFMEQQLEGVKRKTHTVTSDEIYEWLVSSEFVVDDSKLNSLLAKKQEYDDFKKSRMLKESKYSTYESWYKSLREECLENISSNLLELTNLALYICYKLYPNRKKDFVWDIFGSGIVKNLCNKYDSVNIPYHNEDGDIVYLNENYSIANIPINSENDVDIDSLFDNIDETFNDL